MGYPLGHRPQRQGCSEYSQGGTMATPWATGRSDRPETLRIRLCVGDGAWPCVAWYGTWHGYRPQRDIPRGMVWCINSPFFGRACLRMHASTPSRGCTSSSMYARLRGPHRSTPNRPRAHRVARGRVAQGLTVPRGIFALHGRLRRACRVPRRSGRPGEGTGSRNGARRIDRPAGPAELCAVKWASGLA